MFAGVHGAQAGEDVQVVLSETHAVVIKMAGPVVVLVAAKDAIFARDAHDTVHHFEACDFRCIQRGGLADQINFGQCLLCAHHIVGPRGNAGQRSQVLH